MPLYEHIVLGRQDLSGQQMETVIEELKDILHNNGGTLVNSEYWGLKTLAYRIKRNRKAHYAFLNIEAPYPAVAEMERQLSLNEDILRFLTIRVKRHEKEPTVMMQKRPYRNERRHQDERQENSRQNNDDKNKAKLKEAS